MRVGITGATGVIGRILRRKLDERRIPYSSFTGDICSRNDLKEWLLGSEFDSVIHLAALVPTSEVKRSPLRAITINVGGIINLLNELLNAQRTPWFFYASTSHVYKSKNTPITESDPTEPISLYGKTKYMGEKICLEVSDHSEYGLHLCCGRIFSFYHETQKKPFLYPCILERLKNEDLSRPFFLYGANSVRDFLNAEDVVDIIIDLMTQRAIGIYNIGSGRGQRIRDFVQNLTDTTLNIVTNEEEDHLVANIDKLNAIRGSR